MNTYAESRYAVGQGNARSSKRAPNTISARQGIALVAAGLLLTIPCVKAETKLSGADKTFILAAAQGGMTEVKLGELASEKGMRDDVRAFGRMMVKDHTAINSDLKTLAAKKDVTLADGLDDTHQRMVDKMAALTGSEFDGAYIAAMLIDHKDDAGAFQAEADETKDADIQSFVNKSILVIDRHLKHITAMKK